MKEITYDELEPLQQGQARRLDLLGVDRVWACKFLVNGAGEILGFRMGAMFRDSDSLGGPEVLSWGGPRRVADGVEMGEDWARDAGAGTLELGIAEAGPAKLQGETVWLDPRGLVLSGTNEGRAECGDLVEIFKAQGFLPEVSRVLVRPVPGRAEGVCAGAVMEAETGSAAAVRTKLTTEDTEGTKAGLGKLYCEFCGHVSTSEHRSIFAEALQPAGRRGCACLACWEANQKQFIPACSRCEKPMLLEGIEGKEEWICWACDSAGFFTAPKIAGVPFVQDYEVVCGERRVRAGILAGLERVPCVVRVLSDAEAMELQLVENVQRVGLSVMQEADALARLMALPAESGSGRMHSVTSLALRLGKDEKYVGERLALARMEPGEGARVAGETGALGVAHLRVIARLPARALRDEVTSLALEMGLTRDGLMALVWDKYLRELRGAPFSPREVFAAESGAVRTEACEGCALNTKNVEDRDFASGQRAMCMDPGCYRSKVLAEHARWMGKQAKECKAVGSIGAPRVMGWEENEALWEPGRDVLLPQVKLVRAMSVPEVKLVLPSAEEGLQTWAVMMQGRGVPLLWAREPRSRLGVWLVEPKLAQAAAELNGYRIFKHALTEEPARKLTTESTEGTGQKGEGARADVVLAEDAEDDQGDGGEDEALDELAAALKAVASGMSIEESSRVYNVTKAEIAHKLQEMRQAAEAGGAVPPVSPEAAAAFVLDLYKGGPLPPAVEFVPAAQVDLGAIERARAGVREIVAKLRGVKKLSEEATLRGIGFGLVECIAGRGLAGEAARALGVIERRGAAADLEALVAAEPHVKLAGLLTALGVFCSALPWVGTSEEAAAERRRMGEALGLKMELIEEMAVDDEHRKQVLFSKK